MFVRRKRLEQPEPFPDLFGDVIAGPPRRSQPATPAPAPRPDEHALLLSHVAAHEDLRDRAIRTHFPLFTQCGPEAQQRLLDCLDTQNLVTLLIGPSADTSRLQDLMLPRDVVRLVSRPARAHLDVLIQTFTASGAPAMQDLGFELAVRGLPYVGDVIAIDDIYRLDLLAYARFDATLLTAFYSQIHQATGLLPGTDTSFWSRPDGRMAPDPPADGLIYPLHRELAEVRIAEAIAQTVALGRRPHLLRQRKRR
jgi:hypothetical protein